MLYPPPHFEQQKSEVLQRYRILNVADVHIASRIAQTAAMTFGVPIVIAALNERYRKWYQAVHGASASELELLMAFCAQANLSQAAFSIPDVRTDPHFAEDPAVAGPPFVASFAGAPLRDPDGKRFGSLCLIDRVPHDFDADQLKLLESFSEIVSQDICVRSAARYAVRDLIEAEHDNAICSTWQ